MKILRYPLITCAFCAMTLLAANSASSTEIGPQQTVAERLMNDLQSTLGLTRNQAAGLVGNLSYESGNFKTLQEEEPTVPGSAGGWGFAQWTADRRVNFNTYADGRGLARDSYEANRDFLIHELNTSYRGDLEQLKATTTVEEAAYLVMDEYLSPNKAKANFPGRLGRATAFANGDYSGSGYPMAGTMFGSGFAGYEPPATPIETYTPTALMPWKSLTIGSVPVGRAM